MTEPDQLAAGAVAAPSAGPPGTPRPRALSVRLLDPGPRPLEVLGLLSGMGCPPDLAADYVGASAQGTRPEVLVGASTPDATQLAEALRKVGATVSVEPTIEASVLQSAEQPVFPSKRLEVGLVERYLAAYNGGNQVGLVRCLSATAVLSDATGQVLVEGADAIGRRMAEIFERYPGRRVTVLGRLVAGPWVLDHHSTSFGNGASEETVLCLRVGSGLIERLVLLT